MKTTALRLHGTNTLSLDTFDLPEPGENEIVADITTNSICMSSYKLAIQGDAHKRVVAPLDTTPVIVGHEFCGTLLAVGKGCDPQFTPGQKYSIQPALSLPGRELEAPGYSFPYIGGQATKIVIPADVMQQGCLLPYDGEGFFNASLSEPVSCIIGAFNSQYHFAAGSYTHEMGIKEQGSTVILAGAGPMGLGAIDYALHGPKKPALLVITDIDQARLDRAASIFSVEHARTEGVDLRYVNTSKGNAVDDLRALTGGNGFDDVFVFAPVPALIEQGSRIAGFNGCINFFAGPSKSDFFASVNFYDIHYSGHHIVGSSGGNTDDMKEALALMAGKRINPAVMITHIGGLSAAKETILNLPGIPGGKKLIYTQIDMDLVALDDLGARANENPLFATLSTLVKKHNGLWSLEAEEYLLANGTPIEKETT